MIPQLRIAHVSGKKGRASGFSYGMDHILLPFSLYHKKKKRNILSSLNEPSQGLIQETEDENRLAQFTSPEK